MLKAASGASLLVASHFTIFSYDQGVPFSAADAGFPPMPDWFGGNRDFGNLADGLRAHGFSEEETAKVMGANWLAFFERSFGAAT